MPEQTIAVLTLPAGAIDLIENGHPLEALHPNNYPAEQQDSMGQVLELAQALTHFQQLMLQDGLLHALGDDQDANVLFAKLLTNYDLEGVGFEIKADTVIEEGSKGPVRFTFIVSGGGPQAV